MHNSLKRNFIVIFFFIAILDSSAQCAMCRAVLESQESGIQAQAVNDGIVYLMVIPYVIVAVAGFAAYKILSKKKKEKEAN